MTEGAPSPQVPPDGAGEDCVAGGPGPGQAAPAPERPDRAAALAGGPSKVPRAFIVAALACIALLGLGGAALDRAFPGTGDGSAAGGTVTTLGNYPPPFVVTTVVRGDPTRAADPQLPASQSALMGLQKLTVMAAPGFSLVDKRDQRTSLAGLRGRVVVLTFFNSACDDICPVMETELLRAHADLGADAARVSLLTVNTDPLGLSRAEAGPAEKGSLSAVPTWQFLTGSLGQLDSVWRSYGVAVDVQTSTRTVSHNEVMYFIDALGRVRDRATPFANETRSGVYSLALSTQANWAAGIADEARYLLGGDR